MGQFFSSSQSSDQNSGSTTAPWSVQAPYLANAFAGAQGTYNTQSNTPFYSGSMYASLNPQQQGALSGLNSFAGAGGQGATDATNLTNSGTSMLNSGANYGANASGILAQTQQNPTQQNITNATAYANNPATAGMIKAANQPIENQLNEQALPGQMEQSIASGNTNSSREGTAEAILRQSAGTQEANNAATITGQQYDNGLNLSQNANATNLSAGLNANSQVGNAASTGAGILSQGYGTQTQNLNTPLQTGTVQQQDTQGQDTSGYNTWQAQQQYPWNSIDNLFNVVGNKSFGSVNVGASNGQSTYNPSGMQDLSSVYGLLSDPRTKVVEGDDGSTDDSGGAQDAFGNGDTGVTGGPVSNTPDFGSDFLAWLAKGRQMGVLGAAQVPTGKVGVTAPGAGTIPGAFPALSFPNLAQQSSGGSSGGGGGGGIMSMMGGGGGGGGGIMSMVSDPRMKVVGGKTQGALDAVNQIGIKKARYKWDAPGSERPMMMADQVQKVLPSAVTGRPGGPQAQTIKINDMIPIMIGAMKELSNKVDRRKAA